MTRPASDLRQLMVSEFGNRLELILRFTVIIGASVALHIYTESWLGPIWGAIYIASQIAAFVVMSTAPEIVSHARRNAALALYMTTSLIFLIMPITLFIWGDSTLAYCAGMGLVALCVFTLWREDPPDILLPYDVMVGWIVAATALYGTFPSAEGTAARVMVVLLTVTAATYYSLALISTRRNRVKLREAARRGLEARKMESLGRLSGGIAHDFNNILTVLQGSLELHNEVSDPAEKQKLVAEAHASAIRASALVRQLLSFARRAPLTPRLVDTDEVIASIEAMATRLLPASVKITAHAPAVRLHLRTDADVLLSALLNLVINARDAMQGRGHIILRAALAHPASVPAGTTIGSGPYVAFTVQDDGPGLSPAILDKAFEPFFTTKPVGAGSGLGLPSAKGFAEQSGGTLTVTSEPGDTRFTIWLPMANRAET